MSAHAADITARLCQFILATVAAGTNGAFMRKYGISDSLIFTEALATIALVTSVIRLCSPLKWNLSTFLYDLLQAVGWGISLGFLADELRDVDQCGFRWRYSTHQGGKCGLVKSTVSCAFLSIFAWFFSFVLGAWWAFWKVDDWRTARKSRS